MSDTKIKQFVVNQKEDSYFWMFSLRPTLFFLTQTKAICCEFRLYFSKK